MTSVPKPLKFLRTHYDSLKEIYEKIIDKETKVSEVGKIITMISFLIFIQFDFQVVLCRYCFRSWHDHK